MQDRIHPNRRACSWRAPLVAAMLVSGVMIAGCGGGSHSAIGATLGGASSSASTVAADGGGATPGSRKVGGYGSGPLAFSKCMRANGVPNFPDPSPGGGFEFSAGLGRSSPALGAAQVNCQRYMPLPASGDDSGLSAQERAQALRQLRIVAQCMRAHGVPQFPDPAASRPSGLGLGKYREITDYKGVFLLFPATLGLGSPAWNQAAAACGSLAQSFTQAHH